MFVLYCLNFLLVYITIFKSWQNYCSKKLEREFGSEEILPNFWKIDPVNNINIKSYFNIMC